MLQLNYEISRNEGGNKELIFHPDNSLKKIESNAIYLEAPNAKGKSSLLNILAISMYGHKLEGSDSRISPTLKSNIEYMTQRQNQSFTFDVSFSSKDGSIQLISKKTDHKCDDITVQEIENGQSRILPFQVFRDKYYLVYDIPENPLNRLKEIIVEVEHQQERYKKKVSDFRKYLEEIKEELARSRDENEIQTLKSTIDAYKADIKALEEDITKLNERIKVIEPPLALREFINYAKLSASLDDRIKRKSKEVKKVETVKKRHETLYLKKKAEIEEQIDSITRSILSLTKQLANVFIESGDMKLHIEEIHKINLYQAISTYNLNPTIKIELEYMAQEINTYMGRKEIKEAGKKGEFFGEILRILETYRGIGVSIPGTNKSIEELINLLQDEYDKNKEYIELYDVLTQCSSGISHIKDNLDKLPSQLSSLKVALNKQKEMSEKVQVLEPQDISNEIEGLNTELTKALKKVEEYTERAKKYGLSIIDMDESTIQEELQNIIDKNKDYISIFQQDEEIIVRTLEEYNEKIRQKNESIRQIQQKIVQYSQKLSELDNREKHKYDEHASEIEKISSIVDSLEYNLINCGRFVQKINNEDRLSIDSEIEYNDKISQYLALKISEFPYIDEFVKPRKIDFTNKKIYTDTGREIDMKDISTGQAMSMYIQAILNRPSDDNRRLIVIFDEASTMDSNSFQPIRKTLERLINENKLIFALFARAIDGEMKLTKIV